MAGTIDSAVERKRDQEHKPKDAPDTSGAAPDVANTGGPGEGDSSASTTTKRERPNPAKPTQQ